MFIHDFQVEIGFSCSYFTLEYTVFKCVYECECLVSVIYSSSQLTGVYIVNLKAPILLLGRDTYISSNL